MENEKCVLINALSNRKVILKVLVESISSSVIIILVLFILRREIFLKSWIAYSFIFAIIIVLIFIILSIFYFFRTKISSIKYEGELLIINFRCHKTKIKLPISDIDKVLKFRSRRNILTRLILKNNDKFSIWNNGFSESEWTKWENILTKLKLIRQE